MLTDCSIWMQKSVVLLLYNQIFSRLPFAALVIKTYWATLLATYLAVQGASFVDCRPVWLYWQVVPDPGEWIPCPISNKQRIMASNRCKYRALCKRYYPTIHLCSSQHGHRPNALGFPNACNLLP
jgi:hypothetical protein